MTVDNRPHLVEIAAALKEITARITYAVTLTEAVDDLLKVTAHILPDHVQCAVALVGQGEPATFATTGSLAQIVDEVTHAGGDGPCMQAIRTRDIVLSPDLAEEPRWPVWSAGARRLGVHGVLSYPFDVDPVTLGALNVYADRPRGFDNEVPIVAMLIADHAGLLLAMRPRPTDTEPGDRVSERVVERAVGIVMAQRGCPPHQALRHLHDAATHLGVGLHAVAQRLVQTVGERGSAGATDEARA